MPLFVTAAALLFAQSPGASLTGVVRDHLTGAPLVQAAVSLPDLERITLSDAGGRYTFSGIPSGPQHLTVRHVGYAPRALHALVPSRGTLEIDITLEALPVQLDPVHTAASIPVRGLDEDPRMRYPDRGLSMAAVRYHPLLSEPDALQALVGGEIGVRPEAPSGLHVRGGSADHVAYQLDGIPVFSPYHVAGTFSAWNPDALASVSAVTSTPGPGFPDALSGVIVGTTRDPGSRFAVHGGVSTTQARLAVTGPLARGAGYLFSTRTGFPGFPLPAGEPSYLRSDLGDWLGKIAVPLFRGRFQFLAYGNDGEIDAAAAVPAEHGPVTAPRNAFDWYGRSVGAAWAGGRGRALLQFRVWNALGNGNAVWQGADSAQWHMASRQQETGLLAGIAISGRRHHTEAAVRVQHRATTYRTYPSGGADSLLLQTQGPLIAAMIRHVQWLGARAELDMALTATRAADVTRAGPGARLTWHASPRFRVSGGYQWRHQFAQSLRNGESLLGTIYPFEVFASAGAGAVPVARSNQGLVAVEYYAAPGVRLAVQVYTRDLEGLALVAPRDGDPFAVSGPVKGAAEAEGIALEASASGARYGFIATYGIQRVRFDFQDTTYVPEHGAAHAIDAGAIIFPSATLSVRVGVNAVLARRGTSVSAPLEWESCNLMDRGCEFAGTPRSDPNGLGATRLPAYARVDLSIRKHWHLGLSGRDGQLAVFGTVTNVLGRRNVLTVAADPVTGARTVVEMRPRAPLVVGIDWRF